MAPPKFAWPLKKLDEESPQATQTVAKDRDVRRPAPTESKSRSQPRPARTMWTQLTLRTISLLASISTLAIAAYVGAGPIQRIWPVVFVSVSECFRLQQKQRPTSPFFSDQLSLCLR